MEVKDGLQRFLLRSRRGIGIMSCASCIHGSGKPECAIGRIGFPLVGSGCPKFVYLEIKLK